MTTGMGDSLHAFRRELGRGAERRAGRPDTGVLVWFRSGGLDADAPRDRYPEAGGAQACSAFHLRGPRTGRQASAPAWYAGLRHPRRSSLQALRRTHRPAMSGSDSAGEKAPLGRTRTAAEGLDPGALPMRWGDARMGVVLEGVDKSSLLPSREKVAAEG